MPHSVHRTIYALFAVGVVGTIAAVAFVFGTGVLIAELADGNDREHDSGHSAVIPALNVHA